MRSAEESALRKLGDRSLSVFELKTFLLRKNYEIEKVESVISEFLKCGYLNDERFCKEYFRYAFDKNKGKRRVFTELFQKGVDRTTVANAYEDYLMELIEQGDELDEMSMARNEAEKILRLADLSWEDPVPKKIQGRIGRKLRSFGYSTGIIYSILGELKREY